MRARRWGGEPEEGQFSREGPVREASCGSGTWAPWEDGPAAEPRNDGAKAAGGQRLGSKLRQLVILEQSYWASALPVFATSSFSLGGAVLRPEGCL